MIWRKGAEAAMRREVDGDAGRHLRRGETSSRGATPGAAAEVKTKRERPARLSFRSGSRTCSAANLPSQPSPPAQHRPPHSGTQAHRNRNRSTRAAEAEKIGKRREARESPEARLDRAGGEGRWTG